VPSEWFGVIEQRRCYFAAASSALFSLPVSPPPPDGGGRGCLVSRPALYQYIYAAPHTAHDTQSDSHTPPRHLARSPSKNTRPAPPPTQCHSTTYILSTPTPINLRNHRLTPLRPLHSPQKLHHLLTTSRSSAPVEVPGRGAGEPPGSQSPSRLTMTGTRPANRPGKRTARQDEPTATCTMSRWGGG